jgi:hypothetical protein
MTKMLRYLCAAALLCGLAGVAKADDFKMVVVDPPSLNPTAITSDSFVASFGACQANQLPSDLVGTYVGCFTGINLTGAPLTSLQILIPVFDYPQGSPQTAGCPTLPNNQDLFSSITCGTTSNGLDFYVDFSGGNIPTAVNHGDCDYDGDARNLNADDYKCDSASIFTIAEAGVPPNGFPDLTVQADVAVTPEPSSVLLLCTGVLSIGLFGALRRRQSLNAISPSRRTNLS